ncbi:MAG: radical SAM protein [Firmicutes bacterium]|nr:radical SAM protein [Bacillota bacterium]
MAQVTLINPNQMKPAVAPLALEYLAESLASLGHSVTILDLCFSENWQSDVDRHFSSYHPDVIGMTIRNTDDCYFASRDFFVPFYAEIVARIKSLTNAPIVLGGAGLSVAPKAIIDFTNANYAICGDGEFAFPLLVEQIANKENPFDIPGLVYRTQNGIHANVPEWQELAKLPIRTRRWLDNRRYFKEGGQAGVETKRGCNQKCIYCADPVGKGRTCRLRPPKHIIAEIKSLIEQGVDCLHLCDSEFNIPISHAKAICKEIINSNLKDQITWYTYASPVPFTDELAELMKSAGCVGIDFGADSADDLVLKSLGRNFNMEDLQRTAEICHKHKITFMYDLLLGGPGDSRESIRRTIAMMKEISPSRVGVSLGVRIYDGTKIGELVRSQGLSSKNPNLHGVIEGNDSFLEPIYYLSADLGADIEEYVSELIDGDPRFFHASRAQIDSNYNYNDNSVLVRAIRRGARGAYWDILRRLQENEI